MTRRWIHLQWSAGGPLPVLAEVFGVFCVHEVPMRFGAEYRVSHIDGRGTHPVSDGMSHSDAVQIAERMNGVPLDDPDAWAIAEAIFGEVIGTAGELRHAGPRWLRRDGYQRADARSSAR
jgi:hypothetical protein